LEKFAAAITQLGNWSKSNEKVETLIPIILISLKSIKELGCTLRMTDICQFFSAGFISYEIHLGWCVEFTHLSKGELPVLLARATVKACVAQAILGAALVAEPNIVALPNELESRSDVWIMHDPAVCRIHDAVLQEYGSFGTILLGVIRDPEYVQDISILGSHRMSLVAESVLLHNLLEGMKIVRVWPVEILGTESWDE
jgi:hypothetical protein